MKSTIAEIQPRLIIRDNKQNGIQNYDIDNAYPQRIRSAIKASGRTSQCIKIWERFVRGQGFADPFFKTVINNKRMTVDKLLRKLISDYCRFRGFAIHFNFNLLGEIVSMDHVPFEELRLGIEDENGFVTKVKHHPDWAKETGKYFQKEKITEYDLFNPSSVLSQAETSGGFSSYKGQILWYSVNGWKYPEASCDAVFEDVIADDESKQFRLNNIATNFLSPLILETEEFADDDSRDEFKKNIQNFQGARKAGKVFHIEKSKGGGSVEVKKIEVQSMDGLFEKTENATLEAIRRNYMILPVLLGDLIAGKLGTSQEIQDAYAFTNAITGDDRMIFEETFTEIFSFWHDKNANPKNDFAIMPLEYAIKPPNEQPGNTTANI